MLLTCFKSIHERVKSVSIDGHQTNIMVWAGFEEPTPLTAANAGHKTFKHGPYKMCRFINSDFFVIHVSQRYTRALEKSTSILP